MTGDEFRRALSRLRFAGSGKAHDDGLSAFARWLPCDVRTVRGWANDEHRVPSAVGRLLRLMIKLKLTP